MRYEIRLTISYDYTDPADSGRHLLCLQPARLAAEQSVSLSDLKVEPKPDEWLARSDFFGNQMVEIAFHRPVSRTKFILRAGVDRFAQDQGLDMSPPVAALAREVAGYRGLDPWAPHHFTGASARVPVLPEVTAFARKATEGTATVLQAVEALGRAIHRDMKYDPEATTVDTPMSEAFAARHGVCQDFSHIMIAGLRGIGIPAGNVSGFLRTEPPKGKPRLEGADAMHAWVRAWCGFEMGWREYDPTNRMAAGQDHVVIARGRDYSDVAPIRGVMRTAGSQKSKQAVDVIPVVA